MLNCQFYFIIKLILNYTMILHTGWINSVIRLIS